MSRKAKLKRYAIKIHWWVEDGNSRSGTPVVGDDGIPRFPPSSENPKGYDARPHGFLYRCGPVAYGVSAW